MKYLVGAVFGITAYVVFPHLLRNVVEWLFNDNHSHRESEYPMDRDFTSRSW